MNLNELLNDLGIDFKREGESPHATKGWLNIICPFCGTGTRKYGLGINLTHHNTNCWKCGRHTLTEVLVQITGKTHSQCWTMLGGVDFQRLRALPKIQGKLQLPNDLRPLQPIHKNYLERRGFNSEELQKLWKISSIGLASKLAWQIFIPIHQHGRIVSWTTRAPTDTGAIRYISARSDQEAIPAKHCLYGEDYVHHTAIVTEGPTDVWRIGPGAVALMGIVWTNEQVNLLAQIPTRVICFDNESKAQERAEKLCKELEPFPGRTFRARLMAKDPGSASPKEIAQLRKVFLE